MTWPFTTASLAPPKAPTSIMRTPPSTTSPSRSPTGRSHRQRHLHHRCRRCRRDPRQPRPRRHRPGQGHGRRERGQRHPGRHGCRQRPHGHGLTFALTDDAGGRFAIDPPAARSGRRRDAAGLRDRHPARRHRPGLRPAIHRHRHPHDRIGDLDDTPANGAPGHRSAGDTVDENAAVTPWSAPSPPAIPMPRLHLRAHRRCRRPLRHRRRERPDHRRRRPLLDYETATQHNVTVEVTDRTASATAPPSPSMSAMSTRPPTGAVIAGLSGDKVDENAADDTVVGTVAASDPDGDGLTFALTDDAGGRFAIDATTARSPSPRRAARLRDRDPAQRHGRGHRPGRPQRQRHLHHRCRRCRRTARGARHRQPERGPGRRERGRRHRGRHGRRRRSRWRWADLRAHRRCRRPLRHRSATARSPSPTARCWTTRPRPSTTSPSRSPTRTASATAPPSPSLSAMSTRPTRRPSIAGLSGTRSTRTRPTTPWSARWPPAIPMATGSPSPHRRCRRPLRHRCQRPDHRRRTARCWITRRDPAQRHGRGHRPGRPQRQRHLHHRCRRCRRDAATRRPRSPA